MDHQQKMTTQKEQEDQPERREEIGKGNQMTTLRFQAGGTLDIPGLPSGCVHVKLHLALILQGLAVLQA